MYTTSGLDSAKILKPSLLLQILSGIKPPETEILNNVFKRKKNVNSDTASRRIITETIVALPFVGAKNPGVILTGKSLTQDGIKSEPMKAHKRIEASDFDKMKNLLGVELRAALQDEMRYFKDTVAWNREWFARHFLTTGNCDYPLLIGGNAIADSQVYSLGTMIAADAAPGTLFSAATAEVSDVVLHLDHMYEKGKATANRTHFNSKEGIIIYARTAVWNAIFTILDNKQTNSSITGRRIDQDTLEMGGWIIKKFDAETVSPVDQSAGNAIPVKQMRMIDTGPSSPHTMVNLEIANMKATGGNKHVFIHTVDDPYGNFVDIMLQHTPVGLFIPEAMVNSLDVIA